MNLPSVSANTSLKIGKVLDFSKISTFGAPIGAIAISVLILLFVVWPKLTEALRLRSTNAELEVRSLALAQKAQFLGTLDKFELDTQLGAAELILPSEKDVFSFVRQVESAASANGVLLTKVDAAPGQLSPIDEVAPAAASAPGTVVDPAPKIQVKVSMTSDYASLLNFLKTIQSVSRVTGIRDLTISSGASEQSAVLSSSLVIDAYWKPLPSELGSIEAPVEALTEAEKLILGRVDYQLSEGSESAAPLPAIVPSVPVGKTDLFAPF